MIIQPFSSRPETPRFKQSQEAFFNSDFSVFFSEKVPFADRTGEIFAEKLAKLLTSRIMKLHPTDRVTIYELGSGHGLLAKRVLDLLKKKHSSIYQRTTLYVTDSSPALVKNLRDSKIFSSHGRHAKIEILDVAKPKFRQPPNFVYFTNLIDSLPCRHLIIKNGQPWEILVQTSTKPDGGFVEEYQAQPLNQSEDLKELVSSIPAGNDIPIFNYNFIARSLIKTILGVLSPTGFLLISDFGSVNWKDSNPAAPWVEYGKIMPFNVCFPALSEVGTRLAATCLLTQNPPGHQQELLIDKSVNDPEITSLFRQFFGHDNSSPADQFLSQLQDKNSHPETVLKFYRELPGPTQIDYHLLNELALYLSRQGLDQKAVRITDLIKKHYQHMTGEFYYLIRGKALEKSGKLAQAKRLYRQAYKVSHNPEALRQLSRLEKD